MAPFATTDETAQTGFGDVKTPMLRQWKDSDLEPFIRMNADPEVMRYFPAPMTRAEAQDAFGRMRNAVDQRGWGVWAVEVEGDFAGMVGLNVPRSDLPFSPCTEVLWRLRKEYWGLGAAFAAATGAVDYGFSELALDEIVAFTTPPNRRSLRLMERLGFTRDFEGDFDHPAIPEGHALRRHVLYRKKNPNPARDRTRQA
jgi:RimJ/RimL family protein N-acetyltransferase